MATEAAQAAAGADTAPKTEQNAPAKGKGNAAEPAAQGNAASGEKKLSNAELKKRAKEEKAARRAQAKSSHAPQTPAGAGSSTGPGDAKGGPKAKGGQYPIPSHHRSASRSALPPPVIEEIKPKIPECFSHLSMARRLPMTQADKDVNPVVLALGQQMGAFAISDSITRLEATLLAFKKVSRLRDIILTYR